MPKGYITITVPINPPSSYSGEIMDAEWSQFVRMAGGALGIALFEGDFARVLYTYLDMACARGRRDYHNKLVEEARSI